MCATEPGCLFVWNSGLCTDGSPGTLIFLRGDAQALSTEVDEAGALGMLAEQREELMKLADLDLPLCLAKSQLPSD